MGGQTRTLLDETKSPHAADIDSPGSVLSNDGLSVALPPRTGFILQNGGAAFAFPCCCHSACNLLTTEPGRPASKIDSLQVALMRRLSRPGLRPTQTQLFQGVCGGKVK